RLIRPTQPGVFGIAGWRRNASYPAYTAWCIWYCRMATQRVLSGLQPGAFGIAGWRRNVSYPAYSL
ncbi:hypothetical protein, partial [Citrobacter koseri]|uniref:hypothetical protein n=1 Tax=Citrobacter koseri TaxID=545 RepID=UPI002B05C715